MNRILNYKFTSVLLGFIVIWLGLSGFNIFLQHSEVQKNIQDLEGKIDHLEKENVQLEKSQDYARSQSYLERQARLKLNYKLPDEQVVFVYERVASSQPQTLEEKIGQMANYEKWFYYVLGK